MTWEGVFEREREKVAGAVVVVNCATQREIRRGKSRAEDNRLIIRCLATRLRRCPLLYNNTFTDNVNETNNDRENQTVRSFSKYFFTLFYSLCRLEYLLTGYLA